MIQSTFAHVADLKRAFMEPVELEPSENRPFALFRSAVQGLQCDRWREQQAGKGTWIVV
jgi:hypothetical protein